MSELFPFPTHQEPEGTWLVYDPVGVRIKRLPSWEEYDELGALVGSMQKAIPWWVGDLMVMGEDIFGENYTQVLRHFADRGYHTVVNYASVCRAIHIERRRPAVSFTCHRIVAKLSAEMQDYWLARAEKEQLNSDDLDALVNPKEDAEPTEPGEATFEKVLKSAVTLLRKLRDLCKKKLDRKELDNMIDTLKAMGD